MIKELSFEEDGQTKTVKFGPKLLSFLEDNAVAGGDVDIVAGYDNLVMVWANPTGRWAQMIDDGLEKGILDSYNNLDKHVVLKNL